LECGGSYRALVEGVEKGLIKEEDIDVSIKRLLKARFELGEMDDLSEVSWSKIPYSVVASAKHSELALDMTRKTMTLLQNKNNILPLAKKGQKIVVMGPNANDSIMQWGNYNGTPAKTTTILEGIRNYAGNDNEVSYIPGCSWVEETLIHSVYNECK
jgi:beta-glucosidase